MRSIFWSEDALAELDASIAYIAERNPSAARNVLAEINASVKDLGEMPTGRRGRVVGTYEKVVRNRPYIIAYALASSQKLVILRVIHTARDWPENEWPA